MKSNEQTLLRKSASLTDEPAQDPLADPHSPHRAKSHTRQSPWSCAPLACSQYLRMPPWTFRHIGSPEVGRDGHFISERMESGAPGPSASVDSFFYRELTQGHYWAPASGKIVSMLNDFHGLRF